MVARHGRLLSRGLGVLLGVLALGLAQRPDPARACGAFFATESSQNLAIGAQRALMIVHAETIDLHLQLAAATDGNPFAWVVPVPASEQPPSLSLGEAAVFDALDDLTTPTVTIDRGGSGGGGFCGADAKSGDGLGPRGAVDHFGGGTLGDYTFDLVGGKDASLIEAWLEDHDYVVPDGLAETLGPYLAGNVFVAVRLTGGASGDKTLRPLVVTWKRAFGTGLGYAFGLSKISSGARTPLVLWVLADKRQRVANFGSVEVRRVAETMRDAFLEYEAAVVSLTDAAGGALVVTEYAKSLKGASLAPALAALVDDEAFYLTRLFASTPKDAIADLVITFAANAPEVEPAVEVSRGPGGSGVFIAGAVVLLGWWRRRR